MISWKCQNGAKNKFKRIKRVEISLKMNIMVIEKCMKKFKI